ncbi:MAG: hypothetical protein Q4F29_00385 [Lachnospiraceae bacterium]|nr:hypothetical protein [Lachnospiraceae bacterium]
MEEFKVKLGQVRNVVSQNERMARELEDIRSDLYGVKNRLSFRIAQRERINRRLNQQGQALGQERQKLNRAAWTLEKVANRYERTEKELCQTKRPGGSGDDLDSFGGWVEHPGYPEIHPIPGINPIPWIPLRPLSPWPWPWRVWPLLGPFMTTFEPPSNPFQTWVLGPQDFKPEKFFPKFDTPQELISGDTESLIDKCIKYNSQDGTLKDINDKVSDFKKNHSKELGQSRKIYDTTSKSWTTVDGNDADAVKDFKKGLDRSKMEADIKFAKYGGAASAALWAGEAGISGKYGTASAHAEFGKAEKHAEAYAGAYQLNPVTGKMEFKPGIGGSIGGSVTAFTAEEEAALGNDMLGGYAKSTQTLGRAGVEAEGSVGFYDKNGKFNPSAYAGASAEAIGGEITGEAGVKVLGTDVGVSGSLNYGLGAHANFGYQDGKVSVDLGATLGVGADIKLEVDVSGTVDAVCDTAVAAWDEAKDFAGDMADGAKNLGKGVKNFLGF